MRFFTILAFFALPLLASADPCESHTVVAVIDTGIDPTHSQLKNNLWQDPQAPKNKQIYGWDEITNTPNPIDQHGHGTHVSGIIQKEDSCVKIMAVRYYNNDQTPGFINANNSIEALKYAAAHGAKIINYSGGGPEFMETEYSVLKQLEQQGILVISAAGNEHRNVDLEENYYYPAAYRLSNIISVAAIGEIGDDHLLADYSNWGKINVDLAAPGTNIISSLPSTDLDDLGNPILYGHMTGTSQATAKVTGIASHILSQHPHLSATDLKEILLRSVIKYPELKEKVVTSGIISKRVADRFANLFHPQTKKIKHAKKENTKTKNKKTYTSEIHQILKELSSLSSESN